MEEAIKNFPKQFAWEPVIENGAILGQYEKFTICGMGGSALPGDLLSIALTDVEIRTHRDYGLPKEVKNTLIIASSYSGNTEETIDAFETALSRDLPVMAITTGGKLLELARERGVPYIVIPDTGIQPRMATGFFVTALLSMMFEGKYLKLASALAKRLDADKAMEAGEVLGKKLEKKVPIIYSSYKNYAMAYNWKIKFNETAKIPAFANCFPELNHNEMNGFDVRSGNKELSEKFHFIFLKEKEESPKINKRMAVLEKILRDKNLSVEGIAIEGRDELSKIFQNLLVADWTAYFLAKHYHVNPELVPMVEEFKKQIK
ncbi:MAG: bifunctional phosphoglucose/phosphomannose isomerase [bacterium]|nr:bifunctional phosphoglucose/phosphomannose isomerase [bacterium]